jgi:signal transduction histidine kinase
VEPETNTGFGGRRSEVVGLLASTVVVLAVLAGVALHLVNAGTETARGITDWWVMGSVGSTAYGLAGVRLTVMRPRLSIGWVLLLVGVLQGVCLVTAEYGVLAVDRSLPAAGLALWVTTWTWAPSLVVLGAVLPLLVPDGRLPTRTFRPALALSALAVVVTVVQWALSPYDGWAPALATLGVRNPVAVGWVTGPVASAVVVVTLVPAVGFAIAGLAVRWRRAHGEDRQQLKWILFGVALSLVLFALGFALGPLLTALAMLPFPVACLVAVQRHGLWDVEVVISRSLVYGALTLCVVAGYIAFVGLLGGLLGRGTGAPLVATALVAVAAEPLHRRLRVGVNRLLHGDRDDPFAALARLGAELESAKDATTVTEQVLPKALSSLARTLRLWHAAVELLDGLVVATGDRSGPFEELPLTYGGEVVGSLVLSGPTSRLSRADRRLLASLSRQLGVAAHGLLLEREVLRSRALLVTATEEQRRRLYRELHDGVGPSLAALALQVETARDQVRDDPARAMSMLDAVLPRLRGTVDDVRTVIHGLRPPALDNLGLAEALRELGGRFSGPRLSVRVDASDVDGLAAATEVAAYRIVSEALANAARHAGATAVTVRVTRREDALTIVIEDDGSGFDPHAVQAGTGLASMRQRAAELRGDLSVGPRPGASGTRVVARLPVGA